MDEAVGIEENAAIKAYDAVLSDLADRREWETRQEVWYKMRHSGIRRSNKPFPAAADLHYPLVDSHIEKEKPFYHAQTFNVDRLAQFIWLNDFERDLAEQASEWFDYQMKYKTNFEWEFVSAVDNMLMSGVGPLMCYWDISKDKLVFDAIDPIFFVVPKNTVNIEDADRVCRIYQLSEGQYKRKGEVFNQSLLKRIEGGTSHDTNQKENEKYDREGLTHSRDGIVILWEIWERDEAGWIVYTVSPNSPETPVRAPFRYMVNGKPGDLPFAVLQSEIKDKGYYSSRGIPERAGSYESYLNKLWNEKADSLTFLNKPLFTSDSEPGNMNNIKLIPGQVLPYKLSRIDMGQPNMGIDQEMMSIRSIVENNLSSPDLGLQKQGTQDARTAREISYVSQITSMGVALRTRILRQALTKIYKSAWQLLRANAGESFKMYRSSSGMGGMMQLNPYSLQAEYEIEPTASVDQWNRSGRTQRAFGRYQALTGNPYVNQAELTKNLLEEDDPKLVKRMFVPPQPAPPMGGMPPGMMPQGPTMAPGGPIPSPEGMGQLRALPQSGRGTGAPPSGIGTPGGMSAPIDLQPNSNMNSEAMA